MSLNLSIARCGFDSNAGDLHVARAELIGAAADIGILLGHITGTVAPSDDLEQLAVRMRRHRAWLMRQAMGLADKIARMEDVKVKGHNTATPSDDRRRVV